MEAAGRVKVRCREIGGADLDAVAVLLAKGFRRPFAYWRAGLARQAARDVPEGCPRFGFMLEREGEAVGVLLLIYTPQMNDGAVTQRCNLSSWYVEPEFRNYAALLTSLAQKNKQVTFVNATPATNTWPIIEAQGFRRYCRGLFASIPALSLKVAGRVTRLRAGDTNPGLPLDEFERLIRHAAYGCLSFVCHTADGPVPFVFRRWRVRRGRVPLPVVQLIWCRDTEDYVRCAGALGPVLLRYGVGAVLMNANGVVAGLIGRYTERRGQKYTRGPAPPHLLDLSDTEFVIYGP